MTPAAINFIGRAILPEKKTPLYPFISVTAEDGRSTVRPQFWAMHFSISIPEFHKITDNGRTVRPM